MKKIHEVITGMHEADLPSDYWKSSTINFPELKNSHTVIQRNNQSVWDHTMSVIDLLTIKTHITLLSGLFHDLGKSIVSFSQTDSSSRFPSHARESTIIAKRRLGEWGATSYVIDRVCRLVSTHMFDIKDVTKEKTIRKFIANIGRDNVDNWFILRMADSLSYDIRKKKKNNLIESFRIAVDSYLSKQPTIGQPQMEYSDKSGTICIKGDDE